MAKWQNDSMLDAAFDWVRARVTKMTVCNAQPTSYAEVATYALADSALTSTGITLADGDTNGRKMHISSATNVTVDTTGTASHIALSGSTGSVLLYITTCTTAALTTGDLVNIPAWDGEIADAT